MASLTQEQFKKRLVEPVVARLGEIGDEIAAAEDELEELVKAETYNDDKADKVELRIARLRREQARLERRSRSLSRRLGHAAGIGQKLVEV